MKSEYARKQLKSGSVVGPYMKIVKKTRWKCTCAVLKTNLTMELMRDAIKIIAAKPVHVSNDVLKLVVLRQQLVLTHELNKKWSPLLDNTPELIKLFDIYGNYCVTTIDFVKETVISGRNFIKLYIGEIVEYEI